MEAVWFFRQLCVSLKIQNVYIIEDLKGTVLMPPRTYNLWLNISYTAVYSTIYHVPGIGEMILDGLFPRPLKTLLPEVWLKAVPHERSCSWGRCVYLEPGKLVEVLTKIPGSFLPTAHSSIQVDSGGFKHRWLFTLLWGRQMTIWPVVCNYVYVAQLPPEGCIYASTKRVGYVCLRLRILDNFNYVQLHCRY